MTTDSIEQIYTASQGLAASTAQAIESLDSTSAPAFRQIGSGSAVFCGDGSPLTQVAWLAYKADFDARDLDEAEDFFGGRTENWEYVLTPYSSPELLAEVVQRGWTAVQYENVMGRELKNLTERPASDVEVRIVAENDRDAWANVATRGFFGNSVPPGFENLSDVIVKTDGTSAFLACFDGEPAGAATLAVHGKTCYLGGAATLEQFRGRGAQAALLDARLRHALELGCDLAICECLPGSQSQRNQERAGFQVMYTKLVLTRP